MVDLSGKSVSDMAKIRLENLFQMDDNYSGGGVAMNNDVVLLENMLFKSTAKEIEEAYAEVVQLYAHDHEVLNIAKSIKGMCDYIMKAYREIPNPEKKLDESLYTTLYYVLKDLGHTLYDLSIAEGEQVYYVLSSAYQKLNGANNLLERIV